MQIRIPFNYEFQLFVSFIILPKYGKVKHFTAYLEKSQRIFIGIYDYDLEYKFSYGIIELSAGIS